jgi:hypothetical protein
MPAPVPTPAPAQAEETEDEEEYEEEEVVAYTPPPAKKFAIRDVLNKPASEAPATPAHRPAPNPASPFAPVRPAAKVAAAPAASGNTQQQTFDERLGGANRGRFEKIDPTLEEGLDLDVPTFLRKKR